MVPDHIFTVSEITAHIARLLREAFPRATVEGEISNWRLSPAGHAYFKLRDDHAILSAVMFRSSLGRLGFIPQDGARVVARGTIDVYAPQGNYQIKVESLREAGLGDLHLAFLRLKEKLEKEGLFDPALKKPLPRLPKRVGVVTSPTGAAIRDILNVLTRRFAGIDIVLAPVRVQGREAPGEICDAIRNLNALGSIDVMIVGRGGGSLEDLAAFNEESVARAIFESAIPVISAVGHETDFSIADFVADLRAPTPSAAAELVVEEREGLLDRVETMRARLQRSSINRLSQFQLAYEAAAESYVLTQPLARLESLAQRVDDLTSALRRTTRHTFAERVAHWRPLAEKLRALDPDATLARGYSVVTDGEGNVIRDSANVDVGHALNVRLHRGRLGVRVEESGKAV